MRELQQGREGPLNIDHQSQTLQRSGSVGVQLVGDAGKLSPGLLRHTSHELGGLRVSLAPRRRMVPLERCQPFARLRQCLPELLQPLDTNLPVKDAPAQGGKLLLLRGNQRLGGPEHSEIKQHVKQNQGSAGYLESANYSLATTPGQLFPR